MNSDCIQQVQRRKTFAIISHPDAGKTTITEKLLLLGGAIQLAGTVKGRKGARMATSDWMKMEQERGISVTTSVMQFPYDGYMVNLLDTPGHEDFSEDTYRTLTAVDSCLMVIDAAKGVEARTVKLMEVCRLRDTPIFTFVNKMDREVRDCIEVMDEIEQVLSIACAPITWPIGMGQSFKGIYNLYTQQVVLFESGKGHQLEAPLVIDDLHSTEALQHLGQETMDEIADTIELVQGACPKFDLEQYLNGTMTPVFFGTALGNFGIRTMLDYFVQWAPSPLPRTTTSRQVAAEEEVLTGFVFKIQANMDPRHRDRIAFMRLCSGQYHKGMKLTQVRTGKTLKISDALTFMAGDRSQLETAVSGDIIGLHNHGTIQIGDTFTQGEALKFTGIPHFAPELFRRVQLRDPLKLKQLQKGLRQLSEEGATQLFMPLTSNDLILGAVGILQFDVVMARLKDEYHVEAQYEPTPIQTARWVACDDASILDAFQKKYTAQLAMDGNGHLVYLASTRVNLSLTEERHPQIQFQATLEK